MFVALIKSLRPSQWVKNLFVLAPLVFSQHLTEVIPLLKAAGGMFLFCLISGTVYLMNDVFDVEKDRAHPTKRFRPIAAGDLPIKMAIIAGVVIGVGALASSYVLDLRFGIIATTYLTLNAFYSWKLKHIVFLDVVTIALGFLFRTLAGAFAIDVVISEWLFVCTFLLSLYLALGKRRHEVLQAGERKGKQRKVLERYNARHLSIALVTVAVLTVAAYSAYTFGVELPLQALPPAKAPFESHWLPLTIPFAFIGIFRFLQLVNRASDPNSPTERMIRDLPFVINLGLWGVAILVLIYL